MAEGHRTIKELLRQSEEQLLQLQKMFPITTPQNPGGQQSTPNLGVQQTKAPTLGNHQAVTTPSSGDQQKLIEELKINTDQFREKTDQRLEQLAKIQERSDQRLEKLTEMVEKLQPPTISPTQQQENSPNLGANFGGQPPTPPNLVGHRPVPPLLPDHRVQQSTPKLEEQLANSPSSDMRALSLHQDSKDQSLHRDSIDRRSESSKTLEEKLQIAQAQLQQLQKLFRNEASRPEIDEDSKEHQIRFDSAEVISYIPEDVLVGVAMKELVESIDPIAIVADFKMTSFDGLRTPSAHKVFVEMPREVHIWTELANEEISTSNDREFVAILWPYDRGNLKLSVGAEDESHLKMEGVFYYCQELIGQRLIFMPYEKGKKSLIPNCKKVQIDYENCVVEDGILVFDPGGMYLAPTKRRKQCTVESSCVVGIIDAYRVLGCRLIFDPGGELH